MKFARFTRLSDQEIRQGFLTERGMEEITGDIFTAWETKGRLHALEEIKLLAPLVPGSIIGIGKNYAPRVEDRPAPPRIPVLFFKPETTVIGPEDEILIPEGCDQIQYESELAVIIGQEGKNIAEAEAMEYIFGYTICNDVTAPSYFHPEGNWTIGKAFDTFCPLGPVIETKLDPKQVRIEAYHNGEQTQNGMINLMIMSIEQQIAYISSFMTLKPGDVILTGTPPGAGMVRAGDQIACKIEEIGTLANPVSNRYNR